MREYICNRCGKRIEYLPEEAKKNPYDYHICKDCIIGSVREYAKKIADAPLGFASYDLLVYIYWNIEGACNVVERISPPISLTPICPTCGKDMKLHNAVEFESFCENCMAVYDRHGKKVKDVEVKK